MSPSVAATCSSSVSSSCSASSWWKTSARRLYDSIPPADGAGGGTARTTLNCRNGEDMAAREGIASCGVLRHTAFGGRSFRAHPLDFLALCPARRARGRERRLRREVELQWRRHDGHDR